MRSAGEQLSQQAGGFSRFCTCVTGLLEQQHRHRTMTSCITSSATASTARFGDGRCGGVGDAWSWLESASGDLALGSWLGDPPVRCGGVTGMAPAQMMSWVQRMCCSAERDLPEHACKGKIAQFSGKELGGAFLLQRDCFSGVHLCGYTR